MKAKEKCKFLISVDLEEANPYADVFTMEEFIKAVEGGEIMDYDGIGYLAKIDNAGKIWESEFQVDCYVGWLKKQPKEFTHVCWYNK